MDSYFGISPESGRNVFGREFLSLQLVFLIFRSVISHSFLPFCTKMDIAIGNRVEAIDQVSIWSCGVIVAIENDEIVVHFDGYNSRHDRRTKMSEEGFTEIRQKTELSSPLSQETKRTRVKDYEVILLYFLWWFQSDKNGFPHNINMHMVTHRVFQKFYKVQTNCREKSCENVDLLCRLLLSLKAYYRCMYHRIPKKFACSISLSKYM